MFKDLTDTLLGLVRLGTGKTDEESLSYPVDWESLMALAARHGLSAVVMDGIERLPEEDRPPKGLLLRWIGTVVQNYEQRYELYKAGIRDLAGFYSGHGIKMMVLKGYSCSLDWPNPSHRPCGDMDIWLFGKQKEADSLLNDKGIRIDSSHHYHTVFQWHGFMVENHYDFINVHSHRQNAELEVLLKDLAVDDAHNIELDGVRVYLPSPDLNALFLLRHLMGHFASSEINLRQVLDWAFFVERNKDGVNWEWFYDTLDHFHMRDFYDCINGICVRHLGFPAELFPSIHSSKELIYKVLDDIINAGFNSPEPGNVFARVLFKYRRWRSNAWKHRLCYKECLWSAFWRGVWSHLLKPSSI